MTIECIFVTLEIYLVLVTFCNLFARRSVFGHMDTNGPKYLEVIEIFNYIISGLPKVEGLRPKSKFSHLQLRLRLPKVYAAEGRRSSRRLKHLKFSKFKCKFCDKNFRMIKVHVCSVFKKV